MKKCQSANSTKLKKKIKEFANNAIKRRKKTKLLVRQNKLMNEKVLENEILIKKSTNNQKKSKESKKFDNDENVNSAQIVRNKSSESSKVRLASRQAIRLSKFE